MKIYGREVKLGTVKIRRKERDARKSGVVPTEASAAESKRPHPLTAFLEWTSAEPLPFVATLSHGRAAELVASWHHVGDVSSYCHSPCSRNPH